MSGEIGIPGIIVPFVEARRILGVTDDDDGQAIKQAYRRAALEHPPDVDPAAFQKIRDAYETLSDPVPRARQLLQHPLPFLRVPRLDLLDSDPLASSTLAVLLLRRIAAQFGPRETRAHATDKQVMETTRSER